MKFFHSFPRRRQSESETDAHHKGLQILRHIVANGIMLVPEIVTWHDKSMMMSLCQLRFCLTALESSELQKHSKIFGDFSLEFSSSFIRKLGGMPVFYMPQALEVNGSFSGVGSSLIRAIEEIRHLLEMVSDLDSAINSKPDAMVVKARVLGAFADNQKEFVTQAFDLDRDELKKTLEFLGAEKQSFQQLANWAVYMQNIIYPTDNQKLDQELSYYRQKEWRIVSGLGHASGQQDRELTKEEKRKLILLDEHFWKHELTHHLSSGLQKFRRVDRTRVIEKLEGRPIVEHLSAVYVPISILDEAQAIVGNHVRVHSIP